MIVEEKAAFKSAVFPVSITFVRFTLSCSEISAFTLSTNNFFIKNTPTIPTRDTTTNAGAIVIAGTKPPKTNPVIPAKIPKEASIATPSFNIQPAIFLALVSASVDFVKSLVTSGTVKPKFL